MQSDTASSRYSIAAIWIQLAYPVCLVCAMGGSWLAVSAGMEPLLIFALVSAITLVFVLAGEFGQQFYRAWKPRLRENYYPDAVTVVINNLILRSPAAQLAISGVAISLAGGGISVWPNHWPMLAQVPLALVLGELGAYWWHRGCHEIPLLWRFHKIHHSPTRLYWLNATKFHYLDVTLLQSFTVLPVLILGANEVTVLYITLFSIFHGYWQHGNTRQRLGWLNYLVSGAELHRWHHNRDTKLANNNYGSNLIIWDLVFRTFFWPERGHGTSDAADIHNIGIDQLDYPIDPFRQLIKPFARDG